MDICKLLQSIGNKVAMGDRTALWGQGDAISRRAKKKKARGVWLSGERIRESQKPKPQKAGQSYGRKIVVTTAKTWRAMRLEPPFDPRAASG